MDLLTKQIVTSALTTLGGFITGLIASYFATKGKLWAESETLPNLTKELESIKSELTTLTNRHNVLFVEEKESLILFNSDYDNWYSTLQVVMPYSFESIMDSLYSEFSGESNKTYDQLRVSRNRLELFIEDQKIIELSRNLILKTYEQKKHLDYMFGQIHRLKQRHYEIQFEVNPNSEEYFEEIQVQIEKPYEDLMMEYRKYIMVKSKELNLLRTEFHKICRNHIRKNIKSE